MTDDKLIDVHFDGNSWLIEDAALDKPLQFSRLADAETRANDLSRETGRGVRVLSWEGGLIDTMPAATTDDDFSYFDDVSTRFSLLELY